MQINQNQGSIRPHSSKINALARLLDGLIIGITLWAVADVYYVEWSSNYTLWLLLSIVSFQFFAELTEVYRTFRGARAGEEWGRIVLAWGGVYTVFVIAQQFNPIDSEVNKLVFWGWMIAVPIEMVSWHYTIRLIVDAFRRRGSNSRRVAVIGATALGKRLKDIITEESWMGMNFTGYYDDRLQQGDDRLAVDMNEIAGNVAELIEQAKQGNVDIIYIALALRAESRIKDIIEKLSDTTVSVFFVPDLFVFDLLRSRWVNLEGILAVSIYDTPFYGVDGLAKRLLDVALGCIILVLITLPMLLIALAVKLTSRGPVLFKQRRYGFRGEEIEVWKFRSMKVCQDGDYVPQATKNDPRMTSIGGFLRKTSLDELPQFFNVLQGRMSIVGPRPHAVAHNELYRKQVHGYMLRHKVKPGITGLAQVSGFRGETDTLDKMQGRIRYDLQYITNWSVRLDLRIILLTIFKGFVGSNAY